MSARSRSYTTHRHAPPEVIRMEVATDPDGQRRALSPAPTAIVSRRLRRHLDAIAAIHRERTARVGAGRKAHEKARAG